VSFCIQMEADRLIRIICLGSRMRELEALSGLYIQRISYYTGIDFLRLKSSSPKLDKALAGCDIIYVVSPDGKVMDSLSFAGLLSGRLTKSSHACFLIGDYCGFPERLAGRGRKITLSSFTLQHNIAEIVLLEQLYRACTIIKKIPYHH